VRPADLLCIAIVPLVLAGVFLLPEPVRRAYTFYYLEPTLLTAFTAHYVHLSAEHLLSNVLGYLLIVPVSYLVFLLAGRRRFFVASLATLLVAFPFVLSALNLVVPRNAIGFGFSGVNTALLGLLLLGLTAYTRTRLDGSITVRHAGLLFLGSLVGIAVLVLPTAVLFDPLVVAALLGSLLYGWAFSGVRGRSLRRFTRLASRPGYGDLLVVGVVICLAYPLLGFASVPTYDGAPVNHYLHVLGYCLAFLSGALTMALEERIDPAPLPVPYDGVSS
jgi:hypothetical protein